MPTERPGRHCATGPVRPTTWCGSRPRGSYEWLGRPDLGPTIVDLDNLEDLKARLRAELLVDRRQSSLQRRSFRSRLSWYQVRLNGNDWRRFQCSVAAQVERVVIASDLDATRSGLPNVTVIPNTYPRPKQPVGNPAADQAPVVLFQGNLDTPRTSTRRNGWRRRSPHSSERRSLRRRCGWWADPARTSPNSIGPE